jgi:hypothetical protein
MHNVQLTLESAWKVLLLGLVFGAGLPLIFALGIRAMAYGQGGDAELATPGIPAAHPVGRVIGVICFALVVIGVALGITFIVATGFGKALSFEHVYPTIVDK